MQKDIQKMRRHYLHTRAFYLDAVSVLPLDIAYIFIQHEPAIRMNRLIKYHRFWHFLDRTESRTSYPNLFRLASLMQFILVIIHWNACIYFIVSRKIGFGSDSWVYPGIKEGDGNLTELHMSLTRKYIYSFYWSTLTLTTIGEVPPPHSNVEYLIVTIDYLIGKLGEGWGYSTKFCTGRLRSKIQPCTLLYTTLTEKVPLSHTFDKKYTPFTYFLTPHLFLNPWNGVNEQYYWRSPSNRCSKEEVYHLFSSCSRDT